MTNKRIVITGLGGLCGLGNNATDIWLAMKNGTNGVTNLQNEALSDLKIRTAGQVGEIPDIGLTSSALLTMDRFSLLAVNAADEAVKQSGLNIEEANAHRFGAIIGTAICGADAIEAGYQMMLVKGKKTHQCIYRAANYARRTGGPG